MDRPTKSPLGALRPATSSPANRRTRPRAQHCLRLGLFQNHARRAVRGRGRGCRGRVQGPPASRSSRAMRTIRSSGAKGRASSMSPCSARRSRARLGMLRGAWHIWRKCRAVRAGIVFISHYERPYIFLASLMLRLSGKTVFVLQDSKFDDYRRFLWREVFKRLMYKPYQGAIVASPRSGDYVRFLGVNPRADPAELLHHLARARARPPPARRQPRGGAPFSGRAFLCVARLIAKKNHMMLLDAYALYAGRTAAPRQLILCGSGPLEAEIRRPDPRPRPRWPGRAQGQSLLGRSRPRAGRGPVPAAPQHRGAIWHRRDRGAGDGPPRDPLRKLRRARCPGPRRRSTASSSKATMPKAWLSSWSGSAATKLCGPQWPTPRCRSADRGDVAGFVASVLSLAS